LFKGTISDNGYLDHLKISDSADEVLREAKDVIREHVREGFKVAEQYVQKAVLFERAAVLAGMADEQLTPRFRIQGSFAYHTVNSPAQNPPQQIDLDDGIYLPVSFISMKGRAQPSVAASGFFTLVEKILTPLCQKYEWDIDRSKSSCIRILINDEVHIDLPLYSIPDKEFKRITEAAYAADSALRSSVEFADFAYRSIPHDQIMLARRNGTWEPSDPRKIEDWFNGAVASHGKVLRRVCRYLKGWRDYQWPECSLSSITLMACAVIVFDELSGDLPDDRDDIALLKVCERLPSLLSGSIPNPVIPGMMLDEKWKPEERRDFQNRAASLYSELTQAITQTYEKSTAISRLQKVFGKRIPNNQTLLLISSEEAEVKAYPAISVPAPAVQRSKSG
jgi:hypothetical protein